MAKDQAKIEAHIAQWKHNRLLIARIPTSHPDWIATISFYTAVHAVDAALASEGILVWNHQTRFEAIARVNQMRKIGAHYHPLYDLSRKVRYVADPNMWIAPGDLERQVIRRHLLPLEQSVQTLIGRNLNLPLIELSAVSSQPEPPGATSQ